VAPAGRLPSRPILLAHRDGAGSTQRCPRSTRPEAIGWILTTRPIGVGAMVAVDSHLRMLGGYR
jgi:hypothetical protein